MSRGIMKFFPRVITTKLWKKGFDIRRESSESLTGSSSFANLSLTDNARYRSELGTSSSSTKNMTRYLFGHRLSAIRRSFFINETLGDLPQIRDKRYIYWNFLRGNYETSRCEVSKILVIFSPAKR